MTNFKEKHQEAKNLFLEQLAKLLASKEWGNELIKATEAKCGFMDSYSCVLFPEGINQIIQEFEAWQDQQMLRSLEQETAKTKIREKIGRALEIRIIHTVPKTVILKQNGLFLLPTNILLGAECYSKTCDIIWRFAGDKSDDFNYYTKRGLLLCVYASARLFYLGDESEDFVKTKEFIATSLDNIINIASLKNKIKFPNMEDIPIFRMFS